ncbi:MAG: TPR end-of-group domain-containing protein [Thermoanaerobaculia bacterium]
MRSALALALLLTSGSLPAADLPRGKVVEKIEIAGQPGESYALYLPSGYTAERAWPILYILDPRSRGPLAAERFRPGAERYGYILASSNNSASDGPIEPNLKSMRAMWTETHGRLRIDDRRVYVAGFSGTVRSAITLARAAPGTIAGIVGAGAGFPFDRPPVKGDPFVFFGTLGDKDFNYYEVMDLEPRLDAAGILHRIEVFDGVHQWPPEELATYSLGWMEMQAMKAGLRPKDAALIDELWSRTAANARAAEAAGDLFQAHRLYAGAAADFAGLRDAAEAAGKAAALAADPRLQKDWKDRAARLKADQERLAGAPALLAAANPSGEPATVAQVAAALKIHELRKKAQTATDRDERLSAQRILNTIGVQTGYYLPQMYNERKQYDQAVFVLSIAAEVDPDSALTWYSRAEAYARKGDRKRALADLQQAVAKGWKNAGAIERNEAFAPLRRDEEYRKLLESLGSKASP